MSTDSLPTVQFPSVRSGLQILVPSCAFQQDGILDHLSVKVKGPDSPLALQIWRPASTEERNFHLHWYITFTENTGVVERVEDIVEYRDPFGVPIQRGDIVGFHVYPSPNPISVVYHEAKEDFEMFYIEDVSDPYCDLSVCNKSVKFIANVSPSIQTNGKEIYSERPLIWTPEMRPPL